MSEHRQPARDALPCRVLVCLSALALTAAAGLGQEPTAPPRPTPAAGPPKHLLPKGPALLAKAREAMGGQAALDKIESLRMKIDMVIPSDTVKIEAAWAKPGKIWMTQTRGGGPTTALGFDGEIGWREVPNTPDHQLLTPEQIEMVELPVAIHMRLVTLEDRYETIETEDIAGFAGKACYKVRLFDEDRGREFFLYVDAKTSLFAGLSSRLDTPGDPAYTVTSYDDWKEVGGVKLFHKMVNDRGPDQPRIEFLYTAIEANTVDPATFALPDPVKKLVKEHEERPTTKPTGLTDEKREQAEKSLAAFLQKDDPGELRMILGIIEGQLPNTPEADRPQLEYIIERIRERIEELQGGGGDDG